MKFLKNHHRLAVMALCFILTLSTLLLPGCARNSAFSPQDRIDATLSALGAADAKLNKTGSTPKIVDEGCQLYISSETQMGYCFDPATGVMTDIFSFSTLGGDYRKAAEASPAGVPMAFSPESREEDLLKYAKACIGSDLFGSLDLRVDQDQGELHHYTVTESYEGIETGTTVSFSANAQGQITMVNVSIGKIFKQTKDGTWVLAAGDELIGQEAAIEIARDGLKAMDMDIRSVSEDASCKLDAMEDTLVYTIRIGFTYENGWECKYIAAVNAHTGELCREAVTKSLEPQA